jgi:uncharacterized RDD family membrane protein YckC
MTTMQQPDPLGATSYQAKGPSGPRAGFWIRVGAFLLDALALAALYLLFLISAGRDTATILFLLIVVAYFALLEGGSRGQSLGKRACRIRVIDIRVGGPIGPGRAIIRSIGLILAPAFLPLFCLVLLSCLWMVLDRERQTWHDKLAHAVVVPTSAYPVGGWSPGTSTASP